jgi:hypothetical protein
VPGPSSQARSALDRVITWEAASRMSFVGTNTGLNRRIPEHNALSPAAELLDLAEIGRGIVDFDLSRLALSHFTESC